MDLQKILGLIETASSIAQASTQVVQVIGGLVDEGRNTLSETDQEQLDAKLDELRNHRHTQSAAFDALLAKAEKR